MMFSDNDDKDEAIWQDIEDERIDSPSGDELNSSDKGLVLPGSPDPNPDDDYDDDIAGEVIYFDDDEPQLVISGEVRSLGKELG